MNLIPSFKLLDVISHAPLTASNGFYFLVFDEVSKFKKEEIDQVSKFKWEGTKFLLLDEVLKLLDFHFFF